MDVRPANAADANVLAECKAEVAREGSWLGVAGEIDVADAGLRLQAAIAAASSAVWALLDGERIVGYAALTQTAAAGVGELQMLIVACARGRGGGRLLLATLLGHARASALHRVELEVWADNPRAIALYAGGGFVVDGERRYRSRSALIMGLNVASSSSKRASGSSSAPPSSSRRRPSR